MATKTWKLGEVCQGGVITVETSGTQVTVIAKEWDFSTGSRKSSNQSNAKEFNRQTFELDRASSEAQVEEFLCNLATSYHAGKIMDWIKTKATFKKGWAW